MRARRAGGASTSAAALRASASARRCSASRSASSGSRATRASSAARRSGASEPSASAASSASSRLPASSRRRRLIGTATSRIAPGHHPPGTLLGRRYSRTQHPSGASAASHSPSTQNSETDRASTSASCGRQSIDTPIFRQAANLTGRRIKALEPTYPAQQVADAIIRLLERPREKSLSAGPVARSSWHAISLPASSIASGRAKRSTTSSTATHPPSPQKATSSSPTTGGAPSRRLARRVRLKQTSASPRSLMGELDCVPQRSAANAASDAGEGGGARPAMSLRSGWR